MQMKNKKNKCCCFFSLPYPVFTRHEISNLKLIIGGFFFFKLKLAKEGKK